RPRRVSRCPARRGEGSCVLFCTLNYLAFFAAVFAVYWALPWPRARVGLLLAASLCFYACWNKWLAILVTASSTADYLIALGIDRPTTTQRRRKLLLWVSLAANLALLCYFKYANFFLDSAVRGLRALGVPLISYRPLEIILPVGISFYTFEAINYVVDV